MNCMNCGAPIGKSDYCTSCGFHVEVQKKIWQLSNTYYNLGLAQLYLEEEEAAYDSFFKATWSNEQQEMAYYYLAVLDARQARFDHALDMIERSLMKNGHNVNARALKAYILRKLDRQEEAKAQIAIRRHISNTI